MRRSINVSLKQIVLDEPTQDFIHSLKGRRELAGMSQRGVAHRIGTSSSCICAYERGTIIPTLHVLMELAELFGYDLSGSINYKFFHRKFYPGDIKSQLNKYGLTYAELSKLIGYDEQRIIEAVHMTQHGSILCLAAVFEVIRQEKEAEKLRGRLCSKSQSGRKRKS